MIPYVEELHLKKKGGGGLYNASAELITIVTETRGCLG